MPSSIFVRKTPADCFSRREACARSGATESQIIDFARSGVIAPSTPRLAGRGNWRLFTASDLLCIKVALELRRRGFSLEAMRPIIAALRDVRLEAISPVSLLLVADTGAVIGKAEQLLPAIQEAQSGAFLLPLGRLASELQQKLAA